MLKYLIIVLDRAAGSFCHYADPTGEAGLMPLDMLRAVIDFAIRRNLALNCLLGPTSLPPAYEEALDEATHVRVTPFVQRHAHPAAIVVVNSPEEARALTPDPQQNVILRVRPSQFGDLPRSVEALLSRCGRINVSLVDIEGVDARDLKTYETHVETLVAMLRGRYAEGSTVELSTLSDRLLHTAMHNCNAGIEHLTFAPDGNFYLCPGFYHDGQAAVGDLDQGIDIPNSQLLDLDHAPICSACDAYQCKRCIYLNQKLTGEINTPSRQQCVLAHIDRNGTARLLAALGDHPTFRRMKPLEETRTLDPFVRVAQRSTAGSFKVRDGFSLVTLPPLQRVRPYQKR